jgi:hypothetical protein
MRAMGESYTSLIHENRALLQLQLQAYATAVEDDEVRAAAVRGYGRLVDYVETVTGADEETIARFFATGMLLNTLMALGVDDVEAPGEAWMERLLAGCKDVAK